MINLAKNLFSKNHFANNLLAQALVDFAQVPLAKALTAKDLLANNHLTKNHPAKSRPAKHVARSLLFFLLSAVWGAHAQTVSGISIEDRGLDGAIRYYSVRCDRARRLALEHHFKSREFCFVTDGGSECLRTGDAARAAQLACLRAPGGK